MSETVALAGRMVTQAARTKLLVEIEQLSGRYIAELESFIQYLKFKQAGAATATDCGSYALPHEADPLLRVIGVAEAEPFADAIDDTLYSAL
jgi:hypothetical protein